MMGLGRRKKRKKVGRKKEGYGGFGRRTFRGGRKEKTALGRRETKSFLLRSMSSQKAATVPYSRRLNMKLNVS
jgi:hypothetical protein